MASPPLDRAARPDRGGAQWPSADRAAASLVLLVGAATFAWQLQRAWPFVADDAFITFRYAANLVAGHGPTWNPGGPRAEGFSSWGWLLVSAVPELLRIDPVGFCKAVGIGAALMTAWLTGSLASHMAATPTDATVGGDRPPSHLAGAFAAALLLGWFPTAVHAVSGMETLAAAAALAALLRLHLRLAWGVRPRPLALASLSLGVGLLRPELNVVAAALFAASFAARRGADRRWVARQAALGYALPGALFFAARAAWYGHLLPLPFHAKVAGGAALPGLGSVAAFGEALLPMVALPAAVALLLAPRRAALPAVVVGLVAALGLLPDPVMDFDFRYCMPAAPAAFALAGVGLARVVGLVARAASADRPPSGSAPPSSADRAWRLAPVALSVAAILGVAATTAGPATRTLRERRAYGEALEAMNVRFGRTLAALAPTLGRAPRIALGDVGAIAYYSGAEVLDTFSLNEPEIVLGGHHDPAWVLDQDPDLVGVVSTRPREFQAHWANPHDPGLYAACVAEGRRPAVILTFSAASTLWVMTRPGSPIETALRRVYLGPMGAQFPGG